MFDGDGKIVGHVGTVEDITDRKRMRLILSKREDEGAGGCYG